MVPRSTKDLWKLTARRQASRALLDIPRLLGTHKVPVAVKLAVNLASERSQRTRQETNALVTVVELMAPRGSRAIPAIYGE